VSPSVSVSKGWLAYPFGHRNAPDTARSLIGNNRGGVNGWVGRQAIAGMATQVTPAHT